MCWSVQVNRVKFCVLISWIGCNDFNVLDGNGLGLFVFMFMVVEFDCVELLYNYLEDEVKLYLVWLVEKVNVDFQVYVVFLLFLVSLGEIY